MKPATGRHGMINELVGLLMARFFKASEGSVSASRAFFRQLASEANAIDEVLAGRDIDASVVEISSTGYGRFTSYKIKANGERARSLLAAVGDTRWTSLFTELRGSWTTGEFCPVRMTVSVDYYGKIRTLPWLMADLGGCRLGKAIVGMSVAEGDHQPIYIDFSDSRTPHALVAAMSGGGKTMQIMGMLCSLCLSAHPSKLVIYALDTKGALGETRDFDGFDRFPHVHRVQDPEQALGVLEAVLSEIERRNRTGEYEPKVIVAIDELTDLINTNKSRAQKVLTRISQIGRQRGVHLIGGTQNAVRDSIGTDTLTNLSARIVGRVVDHAASQVALGSSDVKAETLPGNGSFYYTAGGDITRVQSYFIRPEDTRTIANTLIERYGAAKLDVIPLESDSALSQDAQDARKIVDVYGDDLFDKHGELAIQQVAVIRLLTGDPQAENAGTGRRRAKAAIDAARILLQQGNTREKPGGVGHDRGAT